MSKFFPTRTIRNIFLLLFIFNVLFIFWLHHVGYIHMAMIFVTFTTVTNALALYSNSRTDGSNAGLNNLIANAGPFLIVYGITQAFRYVQNHTEEVGFGITQTSRHYIESNHEVGSPWGMLYAAIGAIIMIIPFTNAGSNVGADAIMLILDPQEEILTRKQKITSFFFGTIKALVLLAIFASLYFYWKQKHIEDRDSEIRAQIAQTDKAIAVCDNNVKIAQEWLAQGCGDIGHAQQWRDKSARLAEQKEKLKAELSTASPAENAEKASSAHGGTDTIPQPTNPKYYR